MVSDVQGLLGTGLAKNPWKDFPAVANPQDVPKLTLQLADQHAFLDRHGSKVGQHARNIRSIAAPVSLQTSGSGTLPQVTLRLRQGIV